MWRWIIASALGAPPGVDDVGTTLDALHRAAAVADEEAYFDLFSEDAVFVGTDAAERWDLDAFRDFAAPHFEEAPAWVYTPVSREVHLGPKGRTAWFFETLSHATYGKVRGSGAVVLDGRRWRVTQYVLSFPIPNAAASTVLAVVGDATWPPPFTGAALRAAYRPGLVERWEITTPDRTWTRRVEVVAATDEGVTMRGGPVDEGGDPTEEHATFEAAWTDLRDHAAFAMARTTWQDEVEVRVPAGTFATRRYVVTGDDEVVSTFWFAIELPGPPVKMVRTRDGVEVSRMELVSKTTP